MEGIQFDEGNTAPASSREERDSRFVRIVKMSGLVRSTSEAYKVLLYVAVAAAVLTAFIWLFSGTSQKNPKPIYPPANVLPR